MPSFSTIKAIFPNRKRVQYFKEKRTNRQKNVAKYRSLILECATPADFPDSGTYYGQKEREAGRIYHAVVKRLPLKKRILLFAKLRYLEAQAREAYYGVTDNGYSAFDMDRMMVYGR